MNQIEIGKFIAERRRGKNLTQAQLAEKLNITDRAVSKWETGKSMPDSSIMLELCEILGVTVNELLSGEKIDVEHCEKRADENLIDLKRSNENHMRKNAAFSFAFSAVLLVGIMVCLICDIAVSRHLTWSLISVSSIVFAWVISFPSMMWGKKGLQISLISFSVFIIPYLFLLSTFLRVEEILSIGTAIAAASIVFLWIMAAVWRRAGKSRRFLALGIIFLLTIPFMLIINFILSQMIAEPIFDVWDLLSVFVLLIGAFIFFACDWIRKKGWISP